MYRHESTLWRGKSSHLNQRARFIVHEFFGQRVPPTGWVDFNNLARQLRAEHPKLSLGNAAILDILDLAGWQIRAYPRGPNNGFGARISRTGDGGNRRAKRDPEHRAVAHRYPITPTVLHEFLDKYIAPGSEIEANAMYSKFIEEYDCDPIPAQCFTKQLDETKYRVLSTTRFGRKCRMLQRANEDGTFTDLRKLYGKTAA